jgi:hypothetical protein
MRPRALIAASVAAVAVAAGGGWGATAAQAATTCTWGGTPAEPTGSFVYPGQGMTNIPSSEPIPFTATGPLGGGCTGKLTFYGVSEAGSTCAFGTFKATARGLPGVVRAEGADAGGFVPARLYDKDGNVVGSENPQLLTDATNESDPAFTSCGTAEGFKGGAFSSVIELFGSRH